MSAFRGKDGVNERAEYLYKVLTGSVRTYNVSEDGRRQISASHLPGDVFGFKVGGEHTLSAEAIVDCQLLVIRRTSVAALATRDSSVARPLQFGGGEADSWRATELSRVASAATDVRRITSSWQSTIASADKVCSPPDQRVLSAG